MLHGVLLMALFASASFAIGDLSFVKHLSFSPMIVGIILGMLYANSLRNNLPETWVPGIKFCSKRILRFGIILYGFKLSFQDVTAVGLPGICIDAIIVTVTILGGILLGKLLKVDRDIALLTSVGSGICGAAAVLGAESAVRTQPYKTAVAVATVVIFGTTAMFLYPVLYRSGIFVLPPETMGIFAGSTIHEVAHVVAASAAFDGTASSTAVIIKMLRVIMLVPFLFLLNFLNLSQNSGVSKLKSIPWFALFFLVAICVRSLPFFPENLVQILKLAASICLCVAMCALGFGIDRSIFKATGKKPFLLAFFIFLWLICSSLVFVKTIC